MLPLIDYSYFSSAQIIAKLKIWQKINKLCTLFFRCDPILYFYYPA